MTGRELKRLRRDDRTSLGTLACRTRWSTDRLREIEAKDYVADYMAKHYLSALDGTCKFRLATEARKLAAKSRRDACLNRHCCLTPLESGS